MTPSRRAGAIHHLRALRDLIETIQERIPVVFPVHPRTRIHLEATDGWSTLSRLPNLTVTEPLGYLDFMSLLADCRVALTDSGGIQEETTVLGIPYLTLRDNTERPITIDEGTNELVGVLGQRLIQGLDRILRSDTVNARRPHLWDGHAATRIITILKTEIDLIERPEQLRGGPVDDLMERR